MSNRYNDDIRRFEREAEDRYDDYDDDDFDTGLEGISDESYEEVEYLGYEDDYDGEYDSYDQASIGKIDPNDRTLTITISNTSGADAEAIVFGGNQNAPQPAGVTVVVQESSHNEVREESKSNPFKIQGMKMSVSDPLQFDNVWSLIRRTMTGRETRGIYQPRNATSPQNTNANLIDDAAFEMDVSGQDSIRFVIKAGVKATMTFTLKAKVEISNVLGGRNVAMVATAARPTGLPQIDLAQQKPSRVFGVRPSPKKLVRKVVRKPLPAQEPQRRLLKKRRPGAM